MARDDDDPRDRASVALGKALELLDSALREARTARELTEALRIEHVRHVADTTNRLDSFDAELEAFDRLLQDRLREVRDLSDRELLTLRTAVDELDAGLKPVKKRQDDDAAVWLWLERLWGRVLMALKVLGALLALVGGVAAFLTTTSMVIEKCYPTLAPTIAAPSTSAPASPTPGPPGALPVKPAP